MPEFSNWCRICLKENQNTDAMQPLFDSTNLRCNEIVQQIEICGGIVLKPHDDFPKLICQQCLDYLDTSYKFRTMCQNSEHALLDVIIKSELHLESLDSSSQTPTHSEYIELRGEFIDADELDMVEDERLDAEDGFCESFSPMPTENEEEDELLVQEIEVDAVEVVEEEEEELNKTLTKPNVIIKKEPRPLSNRMITTKKKPNKTVVAGGVKRKRGRPRLCALPFAVIKQENEADDDEGAHIQPDKVYKPAYRGRKKNSDMPSGIMCEICGNIYSKPALLHVHMRRHMEEKPFECEICKKRFAGNSEVRRHMRVHTGEKPYVCRFCGRTFADRSTNIKHERIHTNERPFTCNQCGKSFTYSNVLKNHMLIHTGEKPFSCLPCKKTFSRKHQLEQHCVTLTHQTTLRNLADGIEVVDTTEERLLRVC